MKTPNTARHHSSPVSGGGQLFFPAAIVMRRSIRRTSRLPGATPGPPRSAARRRGLWCGEDDRPPKRLFMAMCPALLPPPPPAYTRGSGRRHATYCTRSLERVITVTRQSKAVPLSAQHPLRYPVPEKNRPLNQCCFNVGTASATLAQH